MAVNGVKIVFGTGSDSHVFDDVPGWLDILDELSIKNIDTAEAYDTWEEQLGLAGAASRGFILDTKILSGMNPSPATKDLVIKSGKESLRKLKTESVDVYYIHSPDRRVSWRETLSGLDELYKQGAFKRLGLSNFLGREVDEIVQVAKDNGFVVPSVYQGNYSAIARRTEEELFPVLRKHNMAFYAYSPLAGSFLAKSEGSLFAPNSRFAQTDFTGALYKGMYNKPSYISALTVWGKISESEGISRAELAYRWIVYHSKLQAELGDAVIVGARKQQQLRDAMAAIKKGPLSDGAVEGIEAIWATVKDDAALDNMEVASTIADKLQKGSGQA
ncbi:hypothetical protein PG999_014218 [Apiospora kogelbergensis]|uniref:NADP-dependent oxidoreductase domain-containing protein n=1 Tax=Apiospora kogelbergensis TaxID=1337665 RepID=A0AAW0Q6F5_9PEZI